MAPPLTRLRPLLLVVLLALAAAALTDTPAVAASTALAGSPLAIQVGDQGQLQAFRSGNPNGIFYRPTSVIGDAGFFLAFPTTASNPSSLDDHVFGFEGDAGPTGLDQYTVGAQGTTTGAGTAADPLRQVTTYNVHPASTDLVQITQTTTYVNGSQQFRVRWDVKNTSNGSLNFKAFAGADFFFEGSDRGTGIFTTGPPRFIGGTNADTGNSGGFEEVRGSPSASPDWSAYQALPYNNLWSRIQGASGSTAATFDNSVVGEPVDNAGGVEWDQRVATALPNTQTTSFELSVRNAVPSLLQLTPSNAGSPRGVPVKVTATAVDTSGTPYAGRNLRHTILGANPGAGSVTLDANGQGVITDPGTNAGADTVVAYVDFNNNGVREAAEPQASALATFVDKVPPSCKVSVSGDRPGGGGAGKPLKITVSCNEAVTLTVNTTLEPATAKAKKGEAAAKKRKKRRNRKTIKLKRKTVTIAPGKSVPVKIAIPRSVRRKYAGKRLKATIRITAKDPSGNAKKVKKSRTIRLAKLKKSKSKRRRR